MTEEEKRGNNEKATKKQQWTINSIITQLAKGYGVPIVDMTQEIKERFGLTTEIQDKFGYVDSTGLSKQKASEIIRDLVKQPEKSKGIKPEKKVIQAEIEEPAGGKTKEQEAEEAIETIKTEKGEFSFKEVEGKLLCLNEANEHVYELNTSVPSCTCKDFQIRKQGEWCKHLEAAAQGGYDVAKLPAVEEGKIESEIVSLAITDTEVKIPLQVPTEIITTEDQAVKVITDILGKRPRKDVVIEEFAGIEEISADVILSLAKRLGIEVRPVWEQCERKTSNINLGKVFEQMPVDEQKKEAYLGIAGVMPDTEVTTYVKNTAVAGWKDKNGNMRVGIGVKEEYLTPFRLADLIKRGASVIETMCWTKAAKKAVLNSLPLTKEGLLQKLKATYGWE